MRSAAHASSARRGFTLLELLVVLCILGICGAMTVASVGNQGDLVCAAAARSVMADWSYAQVRAISLRKKVYIQRVGNQYNLLSRDSAASPLTLIQNPVNHNNYTVCFGTGGSSLSRVSLAGWSFGAASTIGFDETGSPFVYDTLSNTSTAMTSTGSITLASGESKINITLQPFTGELSSD